MTAWVELFNYTFSMSDSGRFNVVSFPDGLPYLEQENLAIEMFNLISGEYSKEIQTNG